MKYRSCYNCSKQKRYLNYGEIISSPTVSLEALFTTMVIDSYERHNFRTFDVPGSYLHTKSPKVKHVLLKLKGGYIDTVYNVNL